MFQDRGIMACFCQYFPTSIFLWAFEGVSKVCSIPQKTISILTSQHRNIQKAQSLKTVKECQSMGQALVSFTRRWRGGLSVQSCVGRRWNWESNEELSQQKRKGWRQPHSRSADSGIDLNKSGFREDEIGTDRRWFAGRANKPLSNVSCPGRLPSGLTGNRVGNHDTDNRSRPFDWSSGYNRKEHSGKTGR
jgi:hypothetical protein